MGRFDFIKRTAEKAVRRLFAAAFSEFLEAIDQEPEAVFFDTGLSARLPGVRQPEQVAVPAMRGAVFEDRVIVECLPGEVK